MSMPNVSTPMGHTVPNTPAGMRVEWQLVRLESAIDDDRDVLRVKAWCLYCPEQVKYSLPVNDVNRAMDTGYPLMEHIVLLLKLKLWQGKDWCPRIENGVAKDA